VDDLREARIDLDRTAEVWRAARATYDHVRASGAESAAAVEAFADRLRSAGPQGLSPSEVAIVQDLQDATAALPRALDAEVAARESFLAAEREYKRLELAWASRALTFFHAHWQRTRTAVEVSRG
jgi:hypothetical protein